MYLQLPKSLPWHVCPPKSLPQRPSVDTRLGVLDGPVGTAVQAPKSPWQPVPQYALALPHQPYLQSIYQMKSSSGWITNSLLRATLIVLALLTSGGWTALLRIELGRD
jgi:hypothetical protein